jgi:hypothetical protein
MDGWGSKALARDFHGFSPQPIHGIVALLRVISAAPQLVTATVPTGAKTGQNHHRRLCHEPCGRVVHTVAV